MASEERSAMRSIRNLHGAIICFGVGASARCLGVTCVNDLATPNLDLHKTRIQHRCIQIMRARRSLNQDIPATKCNQGNEPRSIRPSFRIEVCSSFLGAQPIEKEIHPKLRVERTIHSTFHRIRSSSKKFNQK